MPSTTPQVARILARMHHPDLKTIDLSLDRMRRLLARLGDPQRHLPPVIHVAGTNGKGSLIAYLQAILQAAGLRVHRYTSPHLVRFNERIVIAGDMVSDDTLMACLLTVSGHADQCPATFFEATTAAAFLAFAQHPADVALLETGLGGRLDATNVIEQPVLTAITPISFDHCDYLGHTLAQIAGEKAGIIKQGVACIVGPQEPEAMRVLERTACERSAPLYRFGHEWSVERVGGRHVCRSRGREVNLEPGLEGAYQYANAAAAVACIDRMGMNIGDAALERGIREVQWSGRLQPLSEGRYAALLPARMELWLDGGHNPQGGAVLADWLRARGKSAYMIIGMAQGKDSEGYLRALAPCVRQAFLIGIPDEPLSQKPEALLEAAVRAGMRACVKNSLEEALHALPRMEESADAVIGGSLYLAGRVLAAMEIN